MGQVLLKDPDAQLDYSVDWATNYLQSGETISTSTWTVVPSGSTSDVSEAASSNTTAIASITASGGRRDVTYRLTNKVTTSQSRTDERSVVVRVEER